MDWAGSVFRRFQPFGLLQGSVWSCVGFVALTLLAVAGRAQTFTTPINISNDTTGFDPQTVVDAAGNVDIGYLDRGSDAFSNTLWLVRGTFSEGAFHPSSGPVQVAANAGRDFSMALESNCIIDFAYADGVGANMLFAQSRDCGATFTSVNVTNNMAGYAYSDAPHLVVNNGVTELVWLSSALAGSIPNTMFFAQLQSAGTFTAPRSLVTSVIVSDCLKVFAVPASGNTNIFWCQNNADLSVSIEFLNSIGGQPIQIGTASFIWWDSFGPGTQFAVDAAGSVYAVWEDAGSRSIVFSRTNGQDGKFSAPKTLFTVPVVGAAGSGIAVDSNGNITLLLTAQQRIAAGEDTTTETHTILSRHSTDGGNTFTDPSTIATFSCPLCSGGLDQQITLDSSGAVDMVVESDWNPSGFFFSRSNDQGSFSSPVTFAAYPNPTGTVQITTDASNDVFLSWSESPDGNPPGKGGVFLSEGSAPADFTISAAPGAQSELPGGAAKFALTLTATGGFSDAVNLSCTNIPPGAACAFDSSSVTPKSSGSQVTVTVTTPPTLAQGVDKFTVSAASGSITHTQDVQISVGGIASSISPVSATIAAGSSANFQVAMNSTGGFAGPVTLVCSGVPSGMNCGFASPQATLAANGSATSTLTVQVASKPAGSMIPHAPRNFPGPASRNVQLTGMGIAMLVATLFMIALPKKILRVFRVEGEWAHGFAMAALIVFVALGLLSCGGATTPSNTSGGGGTGVTSAGTGGTSGTGSGGGDTGGGTGGSTSVTTQFMVQAQSGGATVNVGTVSITVP
jgi:hypothetical protein